MRAEDTLQYMMDFWGDIFPTRKHCLNHLFCTLENGYHWENGELVTDNAEFLERWQLKEPIDYATPSEAVTKSFLTIAHIKHIDPDKINWFRLSDYSKLSNLPDDIKPDWLELVTECLDYLIKDDVAIPSSILYRIDQLR